MRSGTGRHRRPRQAPALLVTAGVTGAGVALPLLGASGAHAADAGTWDRVADCESGGMWSADKHDGYYGGLQLTLDTWRKYGGTQYAERPDLASRGRQIELAEKVLHAEGPRAWPDCALDSGLTEDSTRPPDLGNDDDATPMPEGPDTGSSHSAPSDSGGTSHGHSAHPAPSDSASPSPGRNDDGHRDAHGGGHGEGHGHEATTPPRTSRGPGETGKPDKRAPEAGRHRGPSGDEARPSRGGGHRAGGGTADDGARTPGRGDHRAEPGKHGKGETGTGTGTGQRTGTGARGHRVMPHETLSQIAAEHDVRGGWPKLYDRNRGVVGDDPDLVRPGQHLRLR